MCDRRRGGLYYYPQVAHTATVRRPLLVFLGQIFLPTIFIGVNEMFLASDIVQKIQKYGRISVEKILMKMTSLYFVGVACKPFYADTLILLMF